MTRDEERRMTTWYNEWEAYPAQWLRNLMAEGLIPKGEVDERDIREIQATDLAGVHVAHFFGGLAGWAYALDLAGWEGPVWTGSCPCTPHSSAAHGGNTAQDLWPIWRNLIANCKPPTIFGEQVAHSPAWLDEVCNDLEGMGYAVGACVLPACSVGADHIRKRVWFCGHANGNGESGRTLNAETSKLPGHRSNSRGMGPTNGIPLRMAQLRAYGNAIVPQVAAEFIKAYISHADTEDRKEKSP